MKLVTFRKNYADEFDCERATVYSDEDWSKYCAALDKVAWPYHMSFGTNEGFDFASKADYLSNCTVRDITEEEEKVLRKVFDVASYNPVDIGVGVDLWYELEIVMKSNVE